MFYAKLGLSKKIEKEKEIFIALNISRIYFKGERNIYNLKYF